MSSRFLDIMGNEVFRYMLDGFFKDWPGTYDVLLADTNEYLFNPTAEERFQGLCKIIRQEAPNGINFCKECDRRNAELAAKSNKPLVYICDAGLLDIAVPITVDNELVATIFCGQRRSSKPEQEKEAQKLTLDAADRLGLDAQRLMRLRNNIPVLLDEDVKKITENLWIMANYLSNLGHEKAELERQRHYLSSQIREKIRIDQAISILGDITEVENEFWRKVNVALHELCDVLGSDGAAVIMYEQKLGFHHSIPTVKAAARFVKGIQGKKYHRNISNMEKILKCPETKVFEMEPLIQPETFWWDIQQIQPEGCHINKFACIPMNLDAKNKGTIIFFLCDFHGQLAGPLLVEDKLILLAPVAERITTAYHNHQLLSEHHAQVKLRGEWLDNLSHQIIAPITGIQGHGENLQRWLRPWAEINKDLKSDRTDWESKRDEVSVDLQTTAQRLNQIDNTLEAIISMTYSANRLARNFAWIGGIGDGKKVISRQAIPNMVSFLISQARNVQGMAKQRGLRAVHVEMETVEKLNNRVAINRILFSQVIGNLLDNAVKYSDRGTDIIISGEVTDGQGTITVTNRGIQISENDVNRIFDREYRTKEAIARYPVGTGIGLTIARDIIQLHGGTLVVTPSKFIQSPDYSGFETSFNVVLPLIEIDADNEKE